VRLEAARTRQRAGRSECWAAEGGLTEADVVAYLVGRRLLSARTVVRGRVAVHDASSRNRNFVVMADPGPSLVVKVAAQRAGSLVEHEAAVYRAISSDEALAALRPFVARYHGYDSRRGVLVLGFIGDESRDPALDYLNDDDPCAQAGAYGRALGVLHAAPCSDEALMTGASRPLAPGILELHRPDVEALAHMTHVTVELIKLVQGTSPLPDLLDRLSSDWQPVCLAHNDVRWTNWVLTGQGASTRAGLLDWELSGRGDPAWDLGSLLAQYLSAWLSSLAVTGQGELDWQSPTAMPLQRVHAAARSTLAAYREAWPRAVGFGANETTRAVRYVAARLLQNAFEEAQVSDQLSVGAFAAVKTSLNVLLRPQEAAVRLLGLSLVDD
jgi:aminoglycoside phosphotransferase (APT) family kinase protein